MLFLLPPSEGKLSPAAGPALDLERISFPPLNPLRRRLLAALAATAARPDAHDLLKVGASLAAEVAADRRLDTAPCAPAAEVFTGVLFEALDLGSLSPAARRAADARVLIASALFGLVRPSDPIPAHRLAIGARLAEPAGDLLPGLAGLWRPALRPLLADLLAHQVAVDARSGGYASAGPLPPARTAKIDVATVRDGRLVTVSHYAKHTRGLAVRHLLEQVAAGSVPATREDVADALRSRWRVELDAKRLLIVVDDPAGRPTTDR